MTLPLAAEEKPLRHEANNYFDEIDLKPEILKPFLFDRQERATFARRRQRHGGAGLLARRRLAGDDPPQRLAPLVGESDSDVLEVSGFITLTNTLDLTELEPLNGRSSILLINNTGLGSIEGTFDDKPEGYELLFGGVRYWLSYEGGDGNDVVLTRAVVSVSPEDADAAESGPAGGASFRISRAGDTSMARRVEFTLSGGALLGDDFTLDSASGFVWIPAGEDFVIVTVTPRRDNLVEGAEDVTLTVTAAAFYEVGSPDNAAVSIADSTSTVTVVANDPGAAENNLNPASFTITREGGDLFRELTVSFTVGGSATAGDDYSGFAAGLQTVTFLADQTTVTLTLTPVADGVTEGSETITVTLESGPDHALGDATTAEATIIDVNHAPTAYGLFYLYTQEDQSAVYDLWWYASDPDGDPLSISDYSQGWNGSVTMNPDGTFTYTPNAGFVGDDWFAYWIIDDRGGVAEGVVQIEVTE